MKNIFIVLLIVAAFIAGGIGVYIWTTNNATFDADRNREGVTDNENNNIGTTTEDVMEDAKPAQTVLGTSAGGHEIIARHFYGTGTSSKEIIFVGGVHGGYSWNTVSLAYELIDHLEDNPEAVPEGLKVTVIPVFNPDGLESVVGTTTRFERSDVPTSEATLISGRFNDNEVDLNRNFDCDWQESGTWQSRTVSGGSAPFSEPEAAAFRDYINANDPTAVVVWYSAAGGVFASSCHNDVSAETRTLTDLFADAADYRPYTEFDFYEITGDMVNWLAKERIPAISVLLTSHNEVEWDKNRAGIEALLQHYAE